MCPKPTRAATLVLALAALASPVAAHGWPFGGAGRKADASGSAATPTAVATATASTATAKPAAPPVKATAAERAQADRLDPIARVAFWTREVGVDPTDVEAAVSLSAALRAMGRNSEAGEAATQILAARPSDLRAQLEFARTQISLERGFYAIAPLKQAAAAQPSDWRPWSLLGVAYEQNEQPDLARDAYERALRLAPDAPQALSNYALFRATHGETQAAEAMLRRAVAAPGAGAAERQNLALVLGLQGKMGEAERLIRQDLPPELADQNLAYLRAISAATTASPNAARARSYSAVQAAEAAQAAQAAQTAQAAQAAQAAQTPQAARAPTP